MCSVTSLFPPPFTWVFCITLIKYSVFTLKRIIYFSDHLILLKVCILLHWSWVAIFWATLGYLMFKLLLNNLILFFQGLVVLWLNFLFILAQIKFHLGWGRAGVDILPWFLIVFLSWILAVNQGFNVLPWFFRGFFPSKRLGIKYVLSQSPPSIKEWVAQLMRLVCHPFWSIHVCGH